jgi:hypothetical protein
MDKMRKQDQTPAQAAARCAGKGRITDLKTRHLAPAGKGKLEVIHHEDGHGMEIKEGKGKKRGKQSAKDFLKKMVGVGGATIPEAKAHGIKPSMKTYVKETVGKGYDEGTAIRESEENSDAEASGRVESTGSGKRSTRAAIVKKVMKDKGLSLIEASKYVKAHGLYKA